MHILGVSGSLRSDSSNTRLLRACARLASHGLGLDLALYEGLAELPHYHPDHDHAQPPSQVVALRKQVRAADALLICTPEYAGGVPGSLKNALDWLVGSTDVADKPAASINASPWSTHAQASLLLTLRMISARVVDESCIELPLRGKKLTDEQIAADPELAPKLLAALSALATAARTSAGELASADHSPTRVT